MDENKASAADFVLWKAAKPGEPSWPSRWGPGRPGWHIECSAMSMANLGEEFDIHGGGADLVFPHHECEIAQSEASTGRRFARVWMHNGFVRIDGDKMSKSLGNFFTIRDILARHSGEAVRYYLLTSHYRSPLNHSPERLEEAEQSLRRLYGALRGLPDAPDGQDAPDRAEGKPSAIFEDRFHKAMDDDFNTPEALAALHELATEVNRRRARDPDVAAAAAAGLRRAGAVLGLLEADPDAVFQAAPPVAVGESPDFGDLVGISTRSRATGRISSAEGTPEAGQPAKELGGAGIGYGCGNTLCHVHSVDLRTIRWRRYRWSRRRSRSASRPGRSPGARRTSRRRTGSGTHWPRVASCWRTAPAGRHGGVRHDSGIMPPRRRRKACGGGVWRSLVAHLLWEQGVGGSNPSTPTIPPGPDEAGESAPRRPGRRSRAPVAQPDRASAF